MQVVVQDHKRADRQSFVFAAVGERCRARATVTRLGEINGAGTSGGYGTDEAGGNPPTPDGDGGELWCGAP